MPRPSRFRILLVGGGHAMLPLLTRARALVTRGLSVTLLTDQPVLYYSGMVPEYLGGVYAHHQVTIDLVGWCARTGVRFLPGRATGLDPDARAVATDSSGDIGFDVAAFDIGSVNPHRDRAAQAIPTKPLHRIEALDTAFEHALARPGEPFRLAIVGGGAAGVEIALNLTGRAQARGARHVQITLVEPEDGLLPGFPTGMGAWAAQTLRARGADVRLGTTATETTPAGIALADGLHLSADAVLWATGSVGAPLFRDAGLATTDKGFVRVAPTLQVENYPYLLAAGDCAAVAGHEKLARVGVHAVKQGPILAHNVARVAAAVQQGRPATGLRTFKPYPLAPLILSTGEDTALWTADGLWLKGRPFLRLKHAVDRRWMRKYLFINHYSGLFDGRSALSREKAG